MPQRGIQTHRTPLFKCGPLDDPMLTPRDERALARVGHDKGPWDEINWFIRLARTKLDESTQGDLLSLQEEFVALSKFYLQLANPSHPPYEEILDVQKTVQKHLEELADKGWTVLPEIRVMHVLTYPHMVAKLAEAAGYPPHPRWSMVRSMFPDCQSTLATPPNLSSLVSVLGQLLDKVGKLIVRCPHCRNIFLQARRNQEYCSRACQSVAIMQRRRAEAKATTNEKPKKRPTKGVSGHGAKKR